MVAIIQPKITFLTKQNLVAMVEASIESTMFRNIYTIVNGEKRDILEDGNLSCAYYVSCILLIFKLINEPHAKVAGLLRDMLENTWFKANGDPLPGDVLTWEPKYFKNSGKIRDHVGFFLKDNIAVSNNPILKTPTTHMYNLYDGRPLKAVYRHPLLVA